MKQNGIVLLAAVLALLLAACAKTAPPGAPGAQVTVSPTSTQLAPGSQKEVTVTFTPQNGFAGTLAAELTLSPATDALTVSPLAPWEISGSQPLTRTFMVAAAVDSAAGEYQATLKFMLDGASIGSVTINVTVVSGDTDPEPNGVPRIASGDAFTLLLAPDGTLWGWGGNFYGQLTQEEAEIPYPQPQPIQGLPDGVDILEIAASETTAYALLENGTIWAWGDDYWGQLGRWDVGDDYSAVPFPVEINAPEPAIKPVTDFTGVVAGGSSVIAWRQDQGTWAWGYNSHSQLGNNSPTTDTPKPTLPSLQEAGVAQLALGTRHGLAVTGDGEIWAWGGAFEGQLGDGVVYEYGDQQLEPVEVLLDETPLAIATGDFHSLAILPDGSVWTWGFDDDGQLGHEGPSHTPAPVTLPEGSVAIQVSGGTDHSLALLNDGTVWAWGSNSYKQLGVDEGGGLTPVEVELPAKAVQVEASRFFSVAVLEDGSVWAWGRNDSGQRGDDNLEGYPDPAVPSQVISAWLPPA